MGANSAAVDGNGNTIGLVDMTTGAKSATYEYNAFGETIISDGPAALANPFRFSTKYPDDETGLLYYGLRYYSPSSGRWPSRDPIDEPGSQLTRTNTPEGGLGEDTNLYLYVRNEPGSHFDPWGLAYFSYRPLAGKLTEAIGVWGNGGDDHINTMGAHEQLFFEDGKNPPNLGYFSDSTFKTESDVSKFLPAHDKGWNDCIMRRAVANVKPSQYCLLGKPGKTEKYNCQDWADAVRVEYRKLMQDPKVVATCCVTEKEKRK